MENEEKEKNHVLLVMGVEKSHILLKVFFETSNKHERVKHVVDHEKASRVHVLHVTEQKEQKSQKILS